MLTGEMIRDVGRAFPLLVLGLPPKPVSDGVPIRGLAELLDAHAEGFRIRHGSIR